MNRTMRWVAAVLLLSFAACARRGPQSSVSFRPARPAVGDSIVVTYVPGTETPLAEADSVFLHIQIYSAEKSVMPEGHEYRMEKRGAKWLAGFRLTKEDAGCILLQFQSDGMRDSNDKVAWHILVHDNKGKPVRGAYFALAQTFLNTFLIDRETDTEKALKYVQKELEANPDHGNARLLLWSLQADRAAQDSSLRTQIAAQLDSLLAANPEDTHLWSSAYGLFNRLQLPEKADSALARLRSLNPKHPTLLGLEWAKIRNLSDPREQISQGLAFYRKTIGTELQDVLRSWLANTMLSEERWTEALAFVDTLSDPDPNLLNSVAWKLVENNRMLSQAAEVAKKAIDIYRSPAYLEKKPVYLPERRWQSSVRRSLGYTLDTYAFALYKVGNLGAAEKAFREAYKLTEGANADITQRYVQCLVDLGKKEEAYEIAKQALSKGRTNEQLNEVLLTLSEELKGDTAEADSLIAVWKQKMAERRAKKLEEKFLDTPEPAPPFTLTTLDGDSVSLGSLKGKIVVIDFWATWCGPCKASFPYLQKFWEEHKEDPDLALFAINCWERKPSREALVKHVKAFIDKNGYTFPVLLDEKGQVADAYKVRGIPTKFFIGPDGKIYVRDVGFGGPDMLDEMNEILQRLRQKFTTS